ncbi:MAG: response regulator [Opitutaceae bacterium]|nr:response regulator [Opitutaceae bacterium]MBP9912658.1 response regulator [Opitutaceae bacterium]
MSIAGRLPRLSVQTKVLLPVLAFLVLLPAITLWIVDDHISQQVQTESRQTLATAETVFLKSLEIRAGDLLSRYRNEVTDSRFWIVAQLRDARTMNGYLGDLLGKFRDDEIALYFNQQGELVSSTRKDPAIAAQDFEQATANLLRPALAGELASGSVSLNGKVYLVVALPVIVSENGPLQGALVVGSRLNENVIQEFKALTNTEILLIADEKQLAASTIQSPDLYDTLIPKAASAAAHAIIPVELNTEHFLTLGGTYGNGGGQPGFHYLLLSSYEQRMRSQADTRRTLLGLSLVGILISGTVVWLFVRRVIHPLRELRDTAEAVGRGDFSRRIERFSDDECGDLAQTFNRMTTNLQGSRAELEKTVATLKGTQAQLVQSEKLSAVGQFVAGVAHELNNPLTAVIGFSDLLVQVSTDDKARPHLELIAKSAHRCHKIVQSLLSFARQHAPERKLIKLNGVIDEVLEIMAYDLRTSNIKVVTQFAAGMPVIMADAHQLQQVFVNILSNARQALQTFRQEGQITVRTRLASDFLHVEFEDNGPGIRPENLSKIFDPFFTTKPVGKGTGLGLSLSYGIISEHGGRITAQSEVGCGTTFIIELPIAADKAGMRADSAAPFTRAPRPLGGGRAVLVVDDEEWIRELIQSLLQQDGYVVQAVGGGESAIEALRRVNFDVIVSDWKMPGMNGIQLYEHLTTADPTAARRVLFMSGDVINDVFNDFLKRHGKTCLPKPFQIDEFRAAVAAVLAGNDG